MNRRQVPNQTSGSGRVLSADGHRLPSIVDPHNKYADQLNLEDDVQSDISEITGITSWMQDIHDDDDDDDSDDVISLRRARHHNVVATGPATSARAIATRAAARQSERVSSTRTKFDNSKHSTSLHAAHTDPRISTDRLSSNQQRLMQLRATQQQRSMSIPNTTRNTIGVSSSRYASPTRAAAAVRTQSDSWRPLTAKNHSNAHHAPPPRVTSRQILSTNPILSPPSAPIMITKSKRSSTGTATTQSESIEALVEASAMVDGQANRDLHLYVGRGMSTNVSVASSVTESHATRYVPGVGRLETPTNTIVASNKNQMRLISSLRDDDGNGDNGNNYELDLEYPVDAHQTLAKSKVASWLASLHLEQYFPLLVNEGYDSMERVRYLDRNELERMDILPGHRRALFHAIKFLRKRRSSTATDGSTSHHNLHMPQISEEGSQGSTIPQSRAGSGRRFIASNSRDIRRLQHGTPPAKQIKFSTSEVRTYQRYWSDNPSVSAGPPVGIGWKILATQRFSVISHSNARDQRQLPTGYCPILSREKREACLKESGFSEKDIASATREAAKAKAKRRTTVQNLNAGKTAEVEEAVESVRRAIVKAFVPKSKSKKQLYNTAA